MGKKYYNLGVLKDNRGVTLLLAILVLSSILAISLSIATVLLVEIRGSGDLLRTEPAFYAASSVIEEGIFKIKRSVPESIITYTGEIGNIKLNDPAPKESSITDPIYQDFVPQNSSFFTTKVRYMLASNIFSTDTPGTVLGGGYSKIKITYLDSGNEDNLGVYVCQYDQNLPSNEYRKDTNCEYQGLSGACSCPGYISSPNYWILSSSGTNCTVNKCNLRQDGNNWMEWFLSPDMSQEIILLNEGNHGNIYVKIEAFGPDGPDEGSDLDPVGIPYMNKKSIDVSGESSGIGRKIKVEIPR